MKSESNDKQLIFTSDKPVLEDQLGTHKHLANLLVQIAQSKSDNPLVVGLFGGWGTGKSSIVKMYDEIAAKHDIKNVYLDAWMFSNARERFGAGLLKSLARELLHLPSREKFISSIDQKTETWVTTHSISARTWGYLIVVLVFLFALVYEVIVGVGLNNEVTLSLMIFLISALVINGLFEFVLPKTMTTAESRTFDESYNKVEHFKKKFKEVIGKSSYQTISVVVDNLDRVEPSDALEVIRVLKTFVSEDILENKRFVLIVPCDENELGKHIEKQLYVEDAHEFLRKFFNISIFVPELVHEDIVSFAKREFEEVRTGLIPSLTDNDAGLVAFVISRAARKSPRQVKVLINSFIGFWQGAGLVGTAGRDRGISALGTVIYVCLAYLRKGQELPQIFSDVFDNFARENDVALRSFLISIREFQQYISDLEWSYLRRLQISDDEKAIPNFVDIYFAITDLDWKVLDELITDDVDLNNIISRLDIKVREGDNVSRERFIKWVLSLVADKTILASSLSYQLIAYINYNFTRPLNEWINLVDEGLAEYLVQVEILPERVVAMMVSLEEKAKKEKPTTSQIQYIVRLINLTKTDYWKNTAYNTLLTRTLDDVIRHFISQKNEKFIETLLLNIHVVFLEETGVALADALANLYLNEKFTGFIVEDMFSDLQADNKGAYTFAAQWLQRNNLSLGQKVKVGQIHLELQSIEVLNKLENPLIFKPILLSENQFAQLIADLERFCVKQNRDSKVDDVLLAMLSICLIVYLTEKIGFQNQATTARRSLESQVWPGFVARYSQLSDDGKTKFLKYLDKYPKILAYAQPHDLAILSQFDELSIVTRMENNQNQFESVISELLDLPYFGKTINLWIKMNISSLKTIDSSKEGIHVKPLFKVIQQKAPASSKYEQISDGLMLLKDDAAAISEIRNHMGWLVDNTPGNNQSAINITIDKLKILEKIVPVVGDINNKLRNKLDVNILGLISDSSRAWIREHLEQ